MTDGDDEEHLSHGIYDAYTGTNLRYSQVSTLSDVARSLMITGRSPRHVLGSKHEMQPPSSGRALRDDVWVIVMT